MAVKSTATQKATRSRRLARARPRVGSIVEPKLRHLEPGTTDYAERERFLAIMRDESRSEAERGKAAIEALPYCYVEADPIVTVTHVNNAQKVGTR